MQFESARFAALVIGTLAAYWLLAGRRVAQQWLLLAVSLMFYGIIAPRALPIMLAATMTNFLIGERVGTDAPNGGRWLAGGVVGNLALLAVFKYNDFFRDAAEGALDLAGSQAALPIAELVLPVGLSFSTFQAISYLLDAHRSTGPRARTLLEFVLFQLLFFQLVMGPICRSSQLLPQLETDEAVPPTRLSEPLGLVATGLFKRMVLASALATHGVSDAFQLPGNFGASALWMILLGYTVQLYCDFSGYTDLMRGIAMLFGFTIPENFRNPYAATNITEFWKRWHMSFSGWLREFVYFPLGGSRDGRIAQYQNLFITMLVCGLWHGASWGFVIWGGLHGIGLIVHKQYSLWRASRGHEVSGSPWTGGIAWAGTLLFVCLSRVFFASSDLESALTYLQRLIDPAAAGLSVDRVLVLGTVIGLAWNFAGDRVRLAFESALDRRAVWAQVAIFCAVLLLLTLLRPGAESPSAYFGF